MDWIFAQRRKKYKIDWIAIHWLKDWNEIQWENRHLLKMWATIAKLIWGMEILREINFSVKSIIAFSFFFRRLHMFKNNLSPNNPNNLYVQDIHARTATITDRSMKIYRIENLGSCCWEAYSKSHFTGERETIFKKHDNAPKIQKLKTARVVIC